MKVSLIVTVLKSYEFSRRQLIYWNKVIPKNWEVIFVDDGSEPEIPMPSDIQYSFQLLRTHDTRKWTQNLARNKAAKLAKGDYLLMIDIDHIIPGNTIAEIDKFSGERMGFPRLFGYLDERYEIVEEIVEEQRGPKHSVAPNIFSIRSDIFNELGGYDEVFCSKGYYGPDDREFNSRYSKLVSQPIQISKNPIYVVYGRQAWFHDLPRT